MILHEPSNNEITKEIDTKVGYKYLGFLEAYGIKHGKMKEQITEE